MTSSSGAGLGGAQSRANSPLRAAARPNVSLLTSNKLSCLIPTVILTEETSENNFPNLKSFYNSN